MINEREKIDQRGTYRNRTYLFPDERRGLGYGQVNPTGFNAPRMAQSQYPYSAPDTYIEDEDDIVFDEDEMDRFVKKINMGYKAVDSLNAKSADPFYFVAGNTTGLGGVSESGMQVAKNSLVPFPGWSKKIQAVSGGFTTQKAYDERPVKQTGTLQGYAHRPPPPGPPEPVEDEIGAYRLQDILDDDELALARSQAIQRRIRRLSQSVLRQD